MSENEHPDEAPDHAGDPGPTNPDPQTTEDTERASQHTDSDGNGQSEGKGRRGAMVVAILALLLALLAIAAVVALGYLGHRRVDSLGQRVATAEQTVETTTQDVILPKISDLNARLDKLNNRIEQHGGALSRLRKDLHQTQRQLTKLTDRVMGGHRRWKLLELEDLLLAANRQLQLEHDPRGAKKALQIVSRQLAKLNDPRLFDIRRKVINEIAVLEAIPNPDIEGLVLKLTSLIERVDQFPLAASVPDEYHEHDNGHTGANARDVPAWKHFLTSIREALEGMLAIRHSGTGPITPLMPPDQIFFLRQNLKLKLQAAKLALLRRNPQTYQASLAHARKWLREFFDTEDPAVAAAIEQLGQMAKVPIGWETPDITGSLTALRKFLDKTREPLGASSGGGNQASANQNHGGGEE